MIVKSVSSVNVDNPHEYFHQIHDKVDASGVPLFSEDVTPDLAELMDETYTRGILAGRIPVDAAAIKVRVRPIYSIEPAVAQIHIEVAVGGNGRETTYCQQYVVGRWVRSAQKKLIEMRAAGTLGPDQVAYRLLMAVDRPCGESPEPPLQAPSIEDGPLDAAGVQGLGDGSLEADRPVLINSRFVEDALRRCEQSGVNETGGAVLGKILRLPEPLPGTTTPIVTILSALVEDPRHVGTESFFMFDPEALAEAAHMGEVRGLGESVLTVFHTHGWTPACSRCEPKVNCSLTPCNPSLQDYELLSLFPSKATLVPIAGRAPGVQGDRPMLQIHAWRGGQYQPIRWQQYDD